MKALLLRCEAAWISGFAPRTVDLAIFRILYATIMLFNAGPLALWVQRTPIAFFNPPLGLTALWPTLPPAGLLIGLNAAFFALLGLLMVGWQTRWVSIAFGCTYLALNSVQYSLGKVNHDILLVIIPFVLSCSGWGRALSLDARKRQNEPFVEPRWTLPFLAFLTGYAMFTAGYVKAITGWLSPDLLCTYGHLMQNLIVGGRSAPVADLVLKLGLPDGIWKALDLFAVGLELLFLPLCFFARSFRLLLAVTTLFHLSVLLLFAIPFSANVLVYALFMRWPRAQALEGRAMPRWIGLVLLALIAWQSTLAIRLERAISTGLIGRIDDLIVIAGAVVGGGFLLRSLASKFKRPRSAPPLA